MDSQREVSNVQHNPGPVEGDLEKKIRSTGGWNSQEEGQRYTTRSWQC